MGKRETLLRQRLGKDKPMMKYFKSECGKLIQYNHETNVYKIRNVIERIDTRLSEEEVLSLNCTVVKKQEFSRLMNVFYKNVKHNWKYDYSTYRKLDNFDGENGSFSSNYILGGKKGNHNSVPLHIIEGKEHFGEVALVYHWGKVYYHTISYNGYEQGQLICPKTFNLVRWAKLKHCAPIMNTNTGRIC